MKLIILVFTLKNGQQKRKKETGQKFTKSRQRQQTTRQTENVVIVAEKTTTVRNILWMKIWEMQKKLRRRRRCRQCVALTTTTTRQSMMIWMNENVKRNWDDRRGRTMKLWFWQCAKKYFTSTNPGRHFSNAVLKEEETKGRSFKRKKRNKNRSVNYYYSSYFLTSQSKSLIFIFLEENLR